MVRIFIVLLVVFICPIIVFADNNGILNTCRPEGKHYHGMAVDDATRLHLMKSYSGIDFPDEIEWEACKATYDLKKAKATKRKEIEDYGVSLAQVYYPAISNFEMLRLLRDVILCIETGSRDLQPGIQAIDNIWQAGKVAVAAINAMTIATEVEAYNAETGPNWP